MTTIDSNQRLAAAVHSEVQAFRARRGPAASPSPPSSKSAARSGVRALVAQRVHALDADDLQNSVLILHGKLGRHGVVEKKKRFFICPGHLRDKEHEGQPASFAVLEVIPKMARVCAYSMQGELLQEYPLNLEKKGKMTVK